MRKIVLATNIAETSITIDDVVFVIDCGKAKESSYDALNNTPCLLPSWISKVSAQQVSSFGIHKCYIVVFVLLKLPEHSCEVLNNVLVSNAYPISS